MSWGIKKVNFKGATKGKEVHELDNLLLEEEVSDLVTGLNITEDSLLVEKGATEDEGGAQRNRRNNLDQLGPKALKKFFTQFLKKFLAYAKWI